MPELPEVETIVRDLSPRLSGRTLRNPRLHKSDVLRRVSKRRLLDSLEGSRVHNVSRRAKHVVVLLRGGLRLIIQPRMTGNLIVYDRALTDHERRYAVLEARVGRKDVLVYRRTAAGKQAGDQEGPDGSEPRRRHRQHLCERGAI